MGRRYLIDGYNLLHAVGMPARLAPGQLRFCRDRLLTLIRQRHPHDSITVVFDAQSAPRNIPREQVVDGMHVVFADGEADDHIATILKHDAVPRTLTVVSSDRAVQESARRRKAEIQSAETFLDDLGRQGVIPPVVAPEKPADEKDVRTWLDAFGSIDDEADVRDMQRIDKMNPDPDRVRKHRGRKAD